MKFLRDIARTIKYKIKFFGIRKNTTYGYLSNSNTDQELKNLMDLYGSDKGGKNNQHIYPKYLI